MTRKLSIALAAAASVAANAAVVYEQPHNGSGTCYLSSWIDPDGTPNDQWAWDSFRLSSATAITEIRWRGGFDPLAFGAGGPVVKFRVQFWSSINGDSQPDVGSYYTPNPLAQYTLNGNANQTAAGTFGGVALYDYHVTLPSAFQAAANTTYWVQIESWQHGTFPDWCWSAGSGGNGTHFRRLEYSFQTVPGDTAFALVTSDAPTFQISASVAPPSAGTVSGAGAYPSGSTAALTATPNAGFGFQNWTEGGVQVSTSQTYTFTVSGDRTLVANFVPAYTISTSASPALGGTTSGGGIFNQGASVTVSAIPNSGYLFVDWTEFGTPVCTVPNYTFAAGADRALVANFMTNSPTVLFDFDNAPVYTSLPLNLTVSGLTAHLSATGSGFSIQFANVLGFTPPGFSGRCLYPNSVFAADLIIDFSETLSAFSILYSPNELGCDDSARMRVTAYLNGAFAGTNTTTAQTPGTWPSETLSISVPAGFNRAVVHYDAPPPTCQDYGVIFMADNMLATVAVTGVSITQQPGSADACASGWGDFVVGAAGSAPVAYQWQAELDTGAWSDLVDGPLMHLGTPLAWVSGAATNWVNLSSLGQFPADRAALNLRCIVSNQVNGATSDVAALTVWPNGSGDVSQNGLVDGADVQSFVNFVLFPASPGAALCAGDFSGDGALDTADIPGMVGRLMWP
ncbi:MAG: hypothetical protein U1A27_12420 [Phycisphaerae bacterium]